MRSPRPSGLRLESIPIPQTSQPLQPGMHLSPAAFRVVIAKLLHRSFVHPLKDLIGQGKRLRKPLVPAMLRWKNSGRMASVVRDPPRSHRRPSLGHRR
jgi:hypothetical protein